MKNTKTVGLFGKLHGLTRKLNTDLPALGYASLALDPENFAHPPGTVAAICSTADLRPSENQRGRKELQDLASLIDSLRDEQIQLIFVSIANSSRAQSVLTDFGRLNLRAESMIRVSGQPYTIVRAMSADDRPGGRHRISWTQDDDGLQNGEVHPVAWADLSQVIVHCVNRPQGLSKTFTVRSTAGEMSDDWDRWFLGLNPDPSESDSEAKVG